MLNGVDPIILFNFRKLLPSVQSVVSKIPIVADVVNVIDLPVIPLYLSESLTGLYIDSESKNIEIDTQIDGLTNGETVINQWPIQSTVKIDMVAKKDSLGVSLLAALTDLIVPKVTSKEYSITYLHGAVTVFAGFLHGFSVTQQENTDLYNITLELIKPAKKNAIPIVSKLTGAVPL